MHADLFHTARPWESPETGGEGRLPMRSPLVPWPSSAKARAAAAAGAGGTAATSPWVLNLDGAWRFALAENPDAVPRGAGDGCFASPDFDDSSWGRLQVPGTWTLQGYDKPHYTNVVMPFGNVPPSAPAAHNPTGLYRVGFELPADWNDALAKRWRGEGALPPAQYDERLLQIEASLDVAPTPETQAARRQLKLRAMKEALEARRAPGDGPADRGAWLCAVLRQPAPDDAGRARVRMVLSALRGVPPVSVGVRPERD